MNLRVMYAVMVVSILLSVGVFGFLNLSATGASSSLLEEQKSELTLSAEVVAMLNKQYKSSSTEFAGCLDLKQQIEYSEDKTHMETAYEITGISDITVSQGENYIQHGFCNYGNIHAHPEGNCFFSLADVYSEQVRFKNGELFAIVMCGEDNFYYITRNNFEEKKINS